MAELYPVTFHGDTIFCVEHDEQPYTPVRPIIENMGLDWASQSVKLNSSKERWGVVIIATPSNGGEQRMGYPVHGVEDSAYGTVKAYHIAVIAAFHVAIRKDPAMLGRYRKA